MSQPETTRRLSEQEIGFRLGIAVAIGEIAVYDQPIISAGILNSCALTPAMIAAARPTNYDMRAVREAARDPHYKPPGRRRKST